jgi:cellulose synthase (UDP-forming)
MSPTDPDTLQAIAPGVALAAMAAAVMPWLSRGDSKVRAVVVAIVLACTLRYTWWRITETLPTLDGSFESVACLLFLIAEVTVLVGTTITITFLGRVSNRSPEADANVAWLRQQPRMPLVDVFVCTYNEDALILERTIVAALAMKYPNFRVWVLDDGRRDWLKTLCEKKGCHYLTRPDNANAKAGNINHGLRHVGTLAEPPDLIAILDADCVPLPQFILRAASLFRSPDTGIVQTTQHFVNPDPIQANLAAHTWPDEQRYFFDVILPSKDAWGIAFCCGAASVLRYSSLMAIGGFPTESITEDFLVTLRMSQLGQKTVYLDEMLSLGLAPEGLREYTVQRTRWCAGLMQIVRGPENPFSRKNRLPFFYRLSLVEVFLYWLGSFSFRIVCIVIPMAYWAFGVRAVHANVYDALSYFLPYYVSQLALTTWLGQGRIMPILSEVNQLIIAPEILRAALHGLIKPKGHKFQVTPKGKLRDQTQVQWHTLRRFAVLLALMVASVMLTFGPAQDRPIEDGGSLCLLWSWYSILVLAVACAICVEKPRFRTDERIDTREEVELDAGDTTDRRRLLDVSVGGLRITGAAPGSVGDTVNVTFRGSRMAATIVRAAPAEFAVRIEGEESREAMIRHFYSDQYNRATWDLRIGVVASTLLRRVFE